MSGRIRRYRTLAPPGPSWRGCTTRSDATVCRCALDAMQRRFTLEEFRAFEARMRAGEVPEGDHERRHRVPPVSFVERISAPRTPTASPPLLVLLHGIGADESDLFPLGRLLDPRFRVVSLRGPHPYNGGAAWFDIAFRPDGRVVPDVPQAHAALDALVEWTAGAPARYGTDPARTFFLGFSQGAMMSLGLLGRVPERLAGVVALSGRYPGNLFEPTARPAAMGRVPVLVAHGTHDDVLPVEHGRRTQEALAPIVTDLTYREYPVGHGLLQEEIALVADWLRARLGPA